MTDFIDGLISVTMIGAMLFIVKASGAFIEQRMNKNNTTKVIAKRKYTVFLDTKEELRIGSKTSFIESRMRSIIDECKNDHKKIVFVKGISVFGKTIAEYENGVLVYNESGKTIEII